MNLATSKDFSLIYLLSASDFIANFMFTIKNLNHSQLLLKSVEVLLTEMSAVHFMCNM